MDVDRSGLITCMEAREAAFRVGVVLWVVQRVDG